MQSISQLVKLTGFGIHEDLWKREKALKANSDMTQGYWVLGTWPHQRKHAGDGSSCDLQ
jgi:hypothetical protein